jgi:hypothetical protein
MLVVLAEELLWGWTRSLMRLLSRFPGIAWAEDWIRRLPPILALPLFVLPWLVMLPVKLAALWLVATGKITKGVLLFVGGEAFGIAFLARLYDLCRPALHRWPWFVILEGIILRWSKWAHRIFAELPPVRALRQWWERVWTDVRRWAQTLFQGEKPPEP